MLEATVEPIARPPAHRLGWVGAALLQPRRAFARIATESRPIWLTPLLALSLTALLKAGVTGWLREQAAASGEIQLPPDFHNYSPEHQAQILKALEATASPVFLYVFPALLALASVWIGWMLLGGMVHLSLTMLGGRADATTTLNLVAWAALPFMIRDLVRVGAMLTTREQLMNPGLSGFVPPGTEGWTLFVASLLSLVDLYWIWQIALLAIGARAAGEISTGTTLSGIVIPALLLLALRAGLATGVGYVSSLTITRPLYF